jgi:mono/diheme cytochrome c family protein
MINVSARRIACWLLPLACCLLPACQQQMAVQPSYRPDETSSFFPDGRAERPVVPGTIARGHLRTDRHLFSGTRDHKSNDWAFATALLGTAAGGNPFSIAALAGSQQSDEVDSFPFPITAETTRDILEHGRNRYMIYCVVCHDPEGTGRGKIVERGYTPPPSYHIERLRRAPVGHFFRVITEGYGSMPEYKQQIPPRDRWAIAAYIRALQLSQHFDEKELPELIKARQATRPDNKEGQAP